MRQSLTILILGSVALCCLTNGCLDSYFDTCYYHYYGAIYHATLKGENVTFLGTTWRNYTVLFDGLEKENISIRYDLYERDPNSREVSYVFPNTTGDVFISGHILMGDFEIKIDLIYAYDGIRFDCDEVNDSKNMQLFESHTKILNQYVKVITDILINIYDVHVSQENYNRHIGGPYT